VLCCMLYDVIKAANSRMLMPVPVRLCHQSSLKHVHALRIMDYDDFGRVLPFVQGKCKVNSIPECQQGPELETK
jgi:hypothetical protein